jgi:AcrR family transcriptional regulator
MSRTGTPTELTPLQEQAFEALLTSPTISAAAEACGVPRRTLHRWLSSDEDFREAYRRAREALFEHVLARLQARAGAAANTLLQELVSKEAKSSDRIRAAIAILELPARLLAPPTPLRQRGRPGRRRGAPAGGGDGGPDGAAGAAAPRGRPRDGG